MAKQHDVINLVRARIRHGDYLLNGVPAERRLAEETGVSHMTARKAILTLIEEGVLTRNAGGRLQIARSNNSQNMTARQLAVLIPNFHSSVFEMLLGEIENTCQAYGMHVRQVHYVHWDDQVVQNALDAFDGVLLIPLASEMPPRVRQCFIKARCPFVSLMADMSEFGIPSLVKTPVHWMDKLLDHLHGLGHQRIDCLNTQPVETVIEQRLEHWQKWCKKNKVEGLIYNHPVESFQVPAELSYDIIDRMIQSKQPLMPALLCTTMNCAMGAIRAFEDHDIKVGKDVAVATVSGEGWGRWTIPRITSLQWGDTTAHMARCIDWIVKGGGPWEGELYLTPTDPLLLIGDSTG